MAIIAQKYSENFPKISRTYHVCLPGETYHSSMHAASDAMLYHIPHKGGSYANVTANHWNCTVGCF